MKMFSIRDVKAEGFNVPFFQPTFGLAERMFQDAVKDEKTSFAKHPEDFSLYYLGEFNTQSGEFSPEAQPKHVCDAQPRS